MDSLTLQNAAELARLVLGHVKREYPHSEGMRLNGAADLAPPHAHHPVFYGSYDWHSCVHGYWLLTRALGRFPQLPESRAIVEPFDEQLTADKVGGELAYFSAPGRGGFERPYGWAWLLKLGGELLVLEHPRAPAWRANLRPLVELIVGRWMSYLPKLGYPIRSGAHNNSAFALALTLDYAEVARHEALRALIAAKARQFFLADRACQAWEPGGEDFLSPAWQEALLMQRVLERDAFDGWFTAFLPELAEGRPANLLQPVDTADRSDGRLAHLDGLNLSRAWCLRQLAAGLANDDSRRALLEDAARKHLLAGQAHLRDDYMGEHWLATFVVLALGG